MNTYISILISAGILLAVLICVRALTWFILFDMAHDYSFGYLIKYKIPEVIFCYPKWRVVFRDTYWGEIEPGLTCEKIIRAKDPAQAKLKVKILQDGFVWDFLSVSPYSGGRVKP